MALLVIGINHTSASVELREKVAFAPERLSDALSELVANDLVESAVIISTCNRSEIYAELIDDSSSHHQSEHEFSLAEQNVIDWLVQFHQVSAEQLRSALYIYRDKQAVAHLMRVACGLDSLVLGEPQILGQVKQAYIEAVNAKAAQGLLDKWFQKAFSVAKRVRTETAIGDNAVSVAYAACLLAKQIFESMSDVTVLLVGAGETIELVAKHVASIQCKKIIVANRTVEKARLVAEPLNADVITLTEIPSVLANVDIVISSTASQLPIIGKGMVETALKQRKHQPMLLVDIAVPRDIEAQVGELDDAYLYCVDDLQNIINENMAQRKAEAIRGEEIIKEEASAFMAWTRSLHAVDSIRDYRSQATAIKQELLEKSLTALQAGGDPQQIIQELSTKLTNRLIHAPTHAMQKVAEQGEVEKLALIRQTLGLDEP